MADITQQQETRAEDIPATGVEARPEGEPTEHVTAEERGEVEQETNGALETGAGSEEEPEVPGVQANGSATTEQSEAAQESRTYTLPIRNKESEHTEKTISAIAEDPASLEAPGVIEQNNETVPAEHSTETPATTTESAAPNGGDSTSTTSSTSTQPQVNGTTPAKSPRVPAYLQSTSASASKSSPKPSPSRLPSARTPLSTSKLNANLRSASNSKPAAAQGSPAAAAGPGRARSPVRTAHLAHLTAPTASSAARKDLAPSAAAAKPLGRAMSVRSKKPVEGSHFLAPTASSVSRKDIQPASGSSFGRTASKRERPGTAAPSATRKVSNNSARTSLPPDVTSTKTTATTRVPSSGSQGKPAPAGSFLDRMTRPTAASSRKTHEKADGVKTPPPAPGKTGGSLGRAASVRTKVNGAVDAAGKKFGGLRGKSGLGGAEKKRGLESGGENGNGSKASGVPHSEEINGNSNSVKEEGTVDGGVPAIGSESQGANPAISADGEIVSER